MYVPVKVIITSIIFLFLMITSFYIFEKKSVKPITVDCYEFSKIIENCEKNCYNYTRVVLVDNCFELGVQKGIYNIRCINKGECIIYNPN